MTNGEKRFCEYQKNRSGSFYTFLFQAISVADFENFAKLYLAFSEECEAYRRFANEKGYWDKLQVEYLNE